MVCNANRQRKQFPHTSPNVAQERRKRKRQKRYIRRKPERTESTSGRHLEPLNHTKQAVPLQDLNHHANYENLSCVASLLSGLAKYRDVGTPSLGRELKPFLRPPFDNSAPIIAISTYNY